MILNNYCVRSVFERNSVSQFLVHWKRGLEQEATWEGDGSVGSQVFKFRLEDKSVFQAVGSDR